MKANLGNPNFVVNGELNPDESGQIWGWTPMERFCKLVNGSNSHISLIDEIESAYSLQCDNDSSGIIFGIRQRIVLIEPICETLFLSAWSRSHNVSGTSDDYYSVSAVFYHIDGLLISFIKQ